MPIVIAWCRRFATLIVWNRGMVAVNNWGAFSKVIASKIAVQQPGEIVTPHRGTYKLSASCGVISRGENEIDVGQPVS